MTDFRDAVTLEGRHVRLEALGPQHAAGILAAADSDDVFRWLTVRRPTTLGEAEALVERYVSDPTLVAWAQIDATTGEVAGATSYYDVVPEQCTVAIGFTWLGQRHWRTGINTEAKLLLLTRAFEDLGCVRVVWHTDELNERSRNAITRLGATFEGLQRKQKRRLDGSWRTTATFSMTDDDWPDVRGRLSERLTRA